MSSMFAFPSVITQNAVPDHACSMTHHTASMIQRKTSESIWNFESLDKILEKADAVKVKGQGKGQTLANCFLHNLCTGSSSVV